MEDPVVYEQMEAFDDNGKYWLYDQKLDTLPGAAIVVNLQGKRFADEGEKSHRVHQAAMKQRRATVVMICDDEAFRPWWENVEYSHRTVQQKFEDVILSDKVGGVLYEADTIEELADMLAQDGPHKVAKYNLLRTIEEYNKAAEEGTTAQLDTPRELGKISPLATPPFHAFPMTISVYAPFGGIAIDTNAQVLDKNRQPIPGLYATSPAAGGIMREVYIGAIASAAVTGRWAGAAAAAEIKA